jgi:uncharacterized LabA/DUF88 family protein
MQGGSISKPLRSNIYVDGFNLYYGALKHTRYKWLNIADLCRHVLPGISIHRIRYFTALVKSNPSNPQARQRQEFYIRALETIPKLTVHYGHFLQSRVSMRLANPQNGQRIAEVLKMEEKGSDVNIATYMLTDAFRQDCDQLIVITNDSDLAEPVRIINRELNIPVGIFNPHTGDTADRRNRVTGRLEKATPSIALKKVARFVRDIRSEGLDCDTAQSQFPDEIVDNEGHVLRKPQRWQ